MKSHVSPVSFGCDFKGVTLSCPISPTLYISFKRQILLENKCIKDE